MSDLTESRIEFEKRVMKDGFGIRYPKRNELLIDLDSLEAESYFLRELERLENELECSLEKEYWESKTPGHMHYVIKLPRDLEPFERIALQAALGSDRRKELISVFRIWTGDPHPVLLAKPPEA